MIIGLGETSFADFFSPEKGQNRGGRDSSSNIEDENKGFNLEAERRRRQKLNDRLLELRSLVPNITNAMIPDPSIIYVNRATIITDAITYIEELEHKVGDLCDQVYQIDASLKEHSKNQEKEITDDAEEMKKRGFEPEIQVTHLSGAKLWIHIVCPKKVGVFTKLMEAFTVRGLDLMDSCVTTSKESLRVTACVEATQCRLPEMDQIKDFLLETVTRT